MKTVNLIKAGEFSTAATIKETTSTSLSGMSVAQMRSRIRVLDALEKAEGDQLVLEDADYATLTDAVNSVAWVRADRDLLGIIDGILNAA